MNLKEKEMRNSLTEKESKDYFRYLYDHVESLTGADSSISQTIRDIIYGKEKDPARVLVGIVRSTGALKPLDWLRDNNIQLILGEK